MQRTPVKDFLKTISHMFITANKKAFNHKIILHRLIFADKNKHALSSSLSSINFNG